MARMARCDRILMDAFKSATEAKPALGCGLSFGLADLSFPRFEEWGKMTRRLWTRKWLRSLETPTLTLMPAHALNPIRAKLTETPERGQFTSPFERIGVRQASISNAVASKLSGTDGDTGLRIWSKTTSRFVSRSSDASSEHKPARTRRPCYDFGKLFRTRS